MTFRLKHSVALGGALAVMAIGVAPAQAQFRLPSKPKIELPKPRTASSSSTTTSSANTSSREHKREFADLIRNLERTINSNTTVRTLKADGERVDADVAAHKADADKLASGRFDGLIARRPDPLDRLRRNYDSLSKRVDREVSWASNMVKGHGVAEAGYNYLLAIDAQFYAAEKLFPGNVQYQQARAKVRSEMAKYGSREGAAAAEDAAELAAARKVKMPPATTRDKRVQDMFRSAYASAGFPYKILKINIQGGWRQYREYGRVVGRERDAYIAAKDPNSDKCNLYFFTMVAENGGGVRRSGHTTKRIACENVK